MEEIRYSKTNETKKRHPIDRANIISRLFFCWLLPYFAKGFKRELNEDDMYHAIRKDESKRLGDKLEAAWNYQITHKKNPSLWRALIRVFRRDLFLSAIFNIFSELIVRLSQPLLMRRLLMFYEPNQTSTTKQDAYMYAGLIVLVSFINALCIHHYYFQVFHIGMKIRVAACSLIYRKALKLSKTALAETTIGQMVNLLSNDVGRFDFTTMFVHNLWVVPIETLIYRLRTAIRTDERVRLMGEIISGIQVIKMYTWEKPFAKLVELSRFKEMQQIRATSVIRALMMSCNLVLNRAAIYLCILTYVLTGNIVNASYAYTLTSFYSILSVAVTFMFPQAVTQLAESNISVQRIRHFLLYDEVALNNETDKSKTNSELINNKSQNGVNAVVGTVGGGKSTLLHVILKELPPLEGNLMQKKYEEVVRVCALERDFNLFPHGDRTLVGARGVMLSGGQKARINLARTIYKDADIYLLDDPLSAVDTHVGKQLFDECICGYLRNKCVVLVTHQLQYLRHVSSIYLFEGGKVQGSGSYSELKATDSEFTRLLVNSEEEIEETADRKSKQLKDNEKDNENQTIPTQGKEERGSGTISGDIYIKYLRAGGNLCKIILLCAAFVISQITASATDYFVTIWVNVEQWRSVNTVTINNNTIANDTYFSTPMADPTISSKSTFNFILDGILTNTNAIIIYSCLVLTTMTLTITRSLSFFRFCMTASTRLHNLMFNKIVYATMWFFNTNPPGRVLNRFSKDIGAVDETLPITMIDTVQVGLTVLGISLLVGSLNPWIFIPTLIILTIFYCLRLVFLATSRDVKRVEAVTRSPIYTHLSASLYGLTTIRAFGAQKILANEFDNYQDKYTAAYFMFLAANRTFGFWLDLHCVIYIGLVTISCLFVQSEVFGGNIGLAITQAMNLTGLFQFGMKQWSELENQMTSVERIQEYTLIKPESDENVKEPPKFWPEEGNIKFDNMCLKYSEDDPYVLKNLTTGAGKSSLIAALFRLADIDGKIVIDNVNTKEISLYSLRSKISIIPQEPVLFSGTLRKNLDPFDEYNDDMLWNVLDEVELKNAISDLPACLDSKVSEGGSNFSVGQRQLLCLARAIIRNNNILVLDEATANVDPHTDGLIQTTIRRKFADCTVLTIAHRLHTIMDSDKVLVMDAGKAVEFDHPYKLLQNPNSVFYGLVKQTGRGMAENLTAIAQENYQNLNK
ncbi:hypothetical protein NQ314_018095 [Rhamnusium bicolor]|uniref:Multidrug resistance-associated protein lethal(2)03659 n=1 Tax=Rhamnusium bicolor TaxID=1586634 RepID=A0AAV8WU01_9CUCU|nr:hypothetical protein NQ314_018095 [Rhamnusium bicolor]